MVMLRSDVKKVQPKLKEKVRKEGEALDIGFDDLNKDARARVEGLFRKVFPAYVMGALQAEGKKEVKKMDVEGTIAIVMKELKRVCDETLQGEDVKKADTWEFAGLLDMPSPRFKKRVAKAGQEWEFSGLCDL